MFRIIMTEPELNATILLPAAGEGSCQQLSNGIIRLHPNSSGKLVLILDVAVKEVGMQYPALK